MAWRNCFILVALVASVGACSSSNSPSPKDAGAEDSSLDSGVTDTGAHDAIADRGFEAAAVDSPVSDAAAPVITQFFSTPEPSLTQITDLIASAKTSIQMIMYWITLPDLAQALAAAAQRGVKVQVIIDNNNWTTSTPQAIQTTLVDAGVSVTPSSLGFSISHCKAMLIDGTTTMIGSINLIYTFDTTRDFAVVTDDPGVASEFASVFATDLQNAADNGMATPNLTNPYLLWSPVNSESGIISLIQSATKTLEVDTENLSDKNVIDALIAAAASGVTVRVLTPECDLNDNPLFDFPAIEKLDDNGVQGRVMPYPSPAFESVAQPYVHGKMIIADRARAFVGSENLSDNSLLDAREVGVLFSDPNAIAAFEADFDQDWGVAIVPPPDDASAVNCPAAPSLTGP